DSTAIADVTGVLCRSRLLGGSLAVGVLVILGLPPFALFASELSIAHGLTDAHLAWALGIAMLCTVVAIAALAANASRMLLGARADGAPAIALPASVRAALFGGLAASIALGVTAGPLTQLFHLAASALVG